MDQSGAVYDGFLGGEMILRECAAVLMLLTGLTLSCWGSAFGGMTEAVEAYKQGDFEKARAAYEALLEKYPDSAELHYNLGNVYFKLRKPGKALVEYERAKRIKPRDYDINENLSYAQGLIEYKMDDKRNWYLIQWSRLMGLVSWNEVVFFSLVLYLAWMILLIVRYTIRKDFKPAFLAKPIFILFLVSLTPLLWKYWDQTWYSEAVVVLPKAEVRYGPSESDKVAFRLVEGLKVRVQQSRSDWFLVGLVNGDSGWCEKKNLEVI